MSDPSMKDPGSALDALVREAKQELTPTISTDAFASMEERILARMAEDAEERSALVDDVREAKGQGRARALRIGAFVLAAAAAIALVAKNEPGGAPRGGAGSGELEVTAGSLRATEGAGVVRVGGQPASAGHVLRAGDVVEAEGARALLERPRKVAWLVEPKGQAKGEQGAGVARVRVKSAGQSLIVGLDSGAIEAQVTPVPSGEAFAVDVAAGTKLVRVAVHGTHLRVSRDGSRVVVDLTEGVVSIGVPPRTGSTYGTMVTAPSHVEFDATDLEHTLTIDHAPTSVRAPVSLVPLDGPVAVNAPEPPSPAPEAAGVVATATVPRPVAAAPASDPSRLGRDDPAARVKPAPVSREAIAAAVRACAAARGRPDNVRVTVTSSLKLKITADGDVETARFDPPLLPEIQTCAATEIYKARLAESAGGSVAIPIEFSY